MRIARLGTVVWRVVPQPRPPAVTPQECRLLRNFSSVYAVVSALQSSPVHRLRAAWGEAARWEDGALAGRGGWATGAEPGQSQGHRPPPPRDSLRVFSNLCQIFSEEDNYSQSRELLLQVRPVPGGPAILPPAHLHIPFFCHQQEGKLQPSLEPTSKKSPRSGSRGGVSEWLGGQSEGGGRVAVEAV